MNRTVSAKRKKRTAAKSGAEGESVRPVFLNAIKGCAVGIGSAVLLLLAASAFAMSTPDPASLAGALSYAVLLIGALVCGIATAKINAGDGMLCGIMSGSLYLVFIFLVSLFLHDAEKEHANFMLSLGLRSVSVLCAIIGACMADKKAKKPKRRKRR